MSTQKRWAYLGLLAIIIAYLVIAVQYARLTPPWQAPDEPAHFNYIRHIVEQGSLPILQPGDYPNDYLKKIVSEGFPPEMSIDPIRYESWQPPLYYLLGATVYSAVRPWPLAQQLVALRLLSVVFGAALLLLTYRIAGTLAPGRTWLALGTTALVATVPMHVAMTAAVNNDTLAEVLIALLLWQMLAILAQQGRVASPLYGRAGGSPLRPWALLGLTLGLAGLTKISTFVVLPLVAATLGYVAWRQCPAATRTRFILQRAAIIGLLALVLLLPWLIRNMSVYGPTDPLVFARHDEVAGGQKRTEVWVQEMGLLPAMQDFALTTFHSFWGQFGWMGVVLDERLYRLFTLFSGLAVLGLLWRLFAMRRAKEQLKPDDWAALLLLAGSVLLAVASLIWYNLTFVQHQGRYLFSALIPIALLLTIGWHEITRRSLRPALAVLLVALAVLLAGRNALTQRPWDKWTLAGLVGLAGGAGAGSWLPESWARWLFALPWPLFLAVDLLCLYGFILPALA